MAGQMGQKGGKNKMSKIVECGMGFMDRKSLSIFLNKLIGNTALRLVFDPYL